MDFILKELCKHPIIVDIIVKGVTNKKGNHEPKSVEWDDGTKSELVYVPKKLGKGLRPVIVEFQENVDEQYTKTQIGSCLQAAEKYDIEPVLLVICTGSISRSLGGKQHKRLPCFDVPCSPWALKCYIMDAGGAYNHVVGVDEEDNIGEHCTVCELDPLVAFAIVIYGNVFDQLQMSMTINPTIAMVSAICDHLYKTLLEKDAEGKVIKQNPTNKFYNAFEKTIIELEKGYNLGEYNKAHCDQYVSRKRVKMISAKKYRQMMKEDDGYSENGEYRGRLYGIA